MGDGLKRARAAARATQLRWWTRDRGRSWQLCEEGDIESYGEVGVTRGDADAQWYALDRSGRSLGTFSTSRAAKLAVRRAVR